MEEELERQYQEQMEEEKLINDEMLHDEEIALEKQKEKLEKDIFEIRMQLKENKILELRKKRGDEVWALRATQALMIKKRNLKKLNKKLMEYKKLLYGGNYGKSE